LKSPAFFRTETPINKKVEMVGRGREGGEGKQNQTREKKAHKNKEVLTKLRERVRKPKMFI